MFEFLVIDDSVIVGILIVLLVFVPLRFNDALVDLLLSYWSSPVEAIEESISEQG